MGDYYSDMTKLSPDEEGILYGLAQLGWEQRSIAGYHLTYIMKQMRRSKIPTRFLSRSDLGTILNPNISADELENVYETSTPMGKWMVIRHPNYPPTIGVEKYFQEAPITMSDYIGRGPSQSREHLELFFKEPFPICKNKSDMCIQTGCCNVHKKCRFFSQHNNSCDKGRRKYSLGYSGILLLFTLTLLGVGLFLSSKFGVPDYVQVLALLSAGLIMLGITSIYGALIGPFTLLTILTGVILSPFLAWVITGAFVVDDFHLLLLGERPAP